jgi:hypothetical protein
MDYSGIRIGPQTLADGVAQAFCRGTKEAAAIGANLNGFYEEANVRGQLFTLVQPLTGTGIAAGHIVGAAAAANTQFAVFNPLNSGKNLALIEFAMAVVSGTFPAGPCVHGYIPNIPTLAASGTPISNIMGGGAASVARCYVSSAGAALTGGLAPVGHKLSNFGSTATVQASPYLVGTIEYLDGKLIVPPGVGWVPMFSAAGTNCLLGWSLTWREVSI